MNKFKLSFLVLFLCCLSSFVSATTIIEDDFDRPDSGTIGGNWTTVGTAEIESNRGKIIDNGASNDYIYQSFLGVEDMTLEFDFEVTTVTAFYFTLYDGASFVLRGWYDGTNINIYTGASYIAVASISINTEYEINLKDFNFTTKTLNAYVNDVDKGSFAFESTSLPDSVSFTAGDAGTTQTVYLDNFRITDGVPDPANFTITARDYTSLVSLSIFNATVNGTNYNTTTGTIITDLNQTGIVNISITASNNNSDLTLSYLDYNLSNNLLFNYSVLEVTANNSRTGLPISTFTTTINDTLNQTSQENKTYYYLTNGTYNLNVSPIGYNYNVTTLILPLGLTELVSEHYAKESVLINIFNATSGLRLNETNVSIQLELNDNITLANTSTGELFLSNLTTGQYQFRFYADDFENTYYEVDIDSNSFQILNVYMTETTPLEVVFTVKKKNTVQVIENVIVSIKKLVGVEWVLVNSLITDLSGKVTFSYENNLRYKFVVTADGYDTKSFELNPIIFSSYNIFMDTNIEVNTPNSHKLSVSYSPGIYYNNKNNTFAVIFSSPTGSLEYYDYTITFKNTSLSDSGNNAYGEELTDVLEILNSSFGDQLFLEYRYLLTGNDMQTVTLSYFVSDPDAEGFTFLDVGNSYGMGLLERVAIITILLLLVGGVAYLFGGVVTSTVSSLLILGYFLFLNFVSGWIIIPTMLFLFLVLIGGSFK